MKKTKDVYYFPHDSNAVEDPKCIKLVNTHGTSGYGLYWILLEKLRQQQNFKLPLDILPNYARYYNAKVKVVESVVRDFDLFVVKDDLFYSETLIKRMKLIYKRREQLSEAGKKGIMQRNKNIQALRESGLATAKLELSCSKAEAQLELRSRNAQANKVKESKEIKENIFIKPSLIEIEDYCRHRSNKIDPEKFFNHYESRGWCMGKNNTPMSDWKAAIHNWEKNEVNEVKADLGVEEWINESGNRTYGKSGVIVPNEAPPRPSRKHIWSIHDKGWRVIL